MWFGTNTEYKKKVKEFQEELYSYGIQEADLPGLSLEYWEELVEAFKIMYEEFPILQNSIKRIKYRCMVNDIGMIEFPFREKMNYDCIENQTLYLSFLLKYRFLSEKLSNLSLKSGKSPVCSMKYNVIHELAHELELLLTQKFDGIVFDDDSVKKERFDMLADNLARQELTQLVLQCSFSVKYVNSLPMVKNCKYAFQDNSEFMAEMLAIYFTAENPVEYSVKFYEGLKYIIRLYKLS